MCVGSVCSLVVYACFYNSQTRISESYNFFPHKQKNFDCIDKYWSEHKHFLHIIFSFGDGVQYPVQIKHFPGNVGNTSNYESMGNSYTLNKFEPISPQTNDTNDSRKNLLNQNNAGAPATSIEHINSIDGQLSAAGMDADLTIVNETNRIWHSQLISNKFNQLWLKFLEKMKKWRRITEQK